MSPWLCWKLSSGERLCRLFHICDPGKPSGVWSRSYFADRASWAAAAAQTYRRGRGPEVHWPSSHNIQNKTRIFTLLLCGGSLWPTFSYIYKRGTKTISSSISKGLVKVFISSCSWMCMRQIYFGKAEQTLVAMMMLEVGLSPISFHTIHQKSTL